MYIYIPENVEFIIETINKAGYEAYIVGGCVRDSLIGRTPLDWDITTSAKPEKIKLLFDKTVDTGIKHGTVTVVIGKINYEVTTFRVDGEYSDNRRPLSVEFTSSITEDLARRDFTINAMAYHPNKGMVDPFGGISDIESHIIRAVGEPSARYREDALRMLRAVRFSAQLNFELEKNTKESIKENCSLINNISQERIRDELTKLITSDHPEKFSLLWVSGMLSYILPEFEACFITEQKNPWHVYNVADHILYTVSSIDKIPVLRWSMLLHDIGKPYVKFTDENGIDHFYGHQQKSVEIAGEILKRLRLDNYSINRILRLVKYHDRSIEPSEKAVRKLIADVGDDLFPDLLKVMEADKKGQNPEKLEKSMGLLASIKNIYNCIKNNGQCILKRDMAVNGDDLVNLGIKPGRELGFLLEILFQKVLDNPENNNREYLIDYARDMINKETGN